MHFKYNKLPSIFQIPSWICCNMEGNDGDRCKDNYSSSSVEMDVYESNLQENEETFSHGEVPFHFCFPLLFSVSSPLLIYR